MRCLLAVGLLVLGAAMATAQDKVEVGQLAPRSIVGHFVAGPFLEQTEASPELCPTLFESEACKIAVFSRGTGRGPRDLAAAVNDLVKEEPRLKWSFWMVSHENDPTPDDAAWQKTLADLQAFAASRPVTAISAGALIRIPDTSKITRARKKVGVFDQQHDLVVMLISPDAREHYGKIRYLKVLDSATLDGDEIAQIQKELSAAVKTALEGK